VAREKAPAFQFYTKDWDTDLNVIPMTYEEEGVYFAIIRLLWNHSTVPANLDDLRLLLKGKPRLSRLQIWWKKIGKCFTVRDGRLCHKRVDQERRKQARFRKSQSDKGKLGGRPKSSGKAAVKPELSSGKALLSASASADQSTPQPPKGGFRKRRGLREVQADPVAIQQALKTQQRRAEMSANGMTDADIEAVFEREYQERRSAAS